MDHRYQFERDNECGKEENILKTVCIVSLGDTRSRFQKWTDQIQNYFPVKIHLISAAELLSQFPKKCDLVIIVGGSTYLNRENLTRICSQTGVDPQRVVTYPEEILPPFPSLNDYDSWNVFFRRVIESSSPETPSEAFHLQPLKRVAIVGKNVDEAILNTFHIHHLETIVPLGSFTLRRNGIQYDVITNTEVTTVGAVAILPEFQNVFSFNIPPDVDETRKVLFLKEFQPKALVRNFRKQTVVFLVPEVIVSPETWSSLYALAQLIVQRDQALVLILCREVIVAGENLETQYRTAREAGVLIEKIDFSKLTLQPTLNMRGAWIDFITERDRILQRLTADWIIKVPGRIVTPTDLSQIVQSDRLTNSMTRPENINLLPYALPLDGWFELPDNSLSTETQYAIQEISNYCQHGVWCEKGRSTVDEEKCVLCLTCLRTCPWSAIDIDGSSKRKKARINWEQCHLCGLCASSCPAGAITWSRLKQNDMFICPAEKILR